MQPTNTDSISYKSFQDPHEGRFPLSYVNPNPDFLDNNAYRKHDKKYGVLTEITTEPTYINSWGWFMIWLLFIPHTIVKQMLNLIILKGDVFWQRVVGIYRSFSSRGISGFYQGYCESSNSTVHGVIYQIGESLVLDVYHNNQSDTRIHAGHFREDNTTKLSDGKSYYLVKQTIQGHATPIQTATFCNGSFEVMKRDPKRMTATFVSEGASVLKLQKMTRERTLIFLVSYCLDLLQTLLPPAKNPFTAHGQWIVIFNQIIAALHTSAGYTVPVYTPVDQIYDSQYTAHLDSVEDHKQTARELALRSKDPNMRNMIGVANRLLLNDLSSVVKPKTNQTSSE